jgi:hypothetical protein
VKPPNTAVIRMSNGRIGAGEFSAGVNWYVVNGTGRRETCVVIFKRADQGETDRPFPRPGARRLDQADSI